MRHTARSSFFTGDLTGCDPRQAHPGAIRVIPHISAAAVIDAAASSSHRKLAESIQLGERAQALRSAEGLSRAAQNIQELPLGKVADSIGRYYRALSLNRQGPKALPKADKILIDVADHGPLLLRAKARVALATNLRIAGDDKAALEIYREAARIAGSCEQGGLHPVFLAAFQCALMKDDEGDHRGAVADFEKLEPLALQVGVELPPLLHQYYNNLAFFLIADGRAGEASRFRDVLLTSPFHNAYPELQRTCADLDRKMRPPSRSFVSMSVGTPFTGEPEALTASVTLAPDLCAVEFQQLSVPLKEGPPATLESRSESVGPAEIAATLLLVKAVCQQRRRIRISLFAARLLRHSFIAARNGILFARQIRAYLRPFRWSYLRLYPAYPRPPNV
jgi:tetratricopeptide (TPR) repeat protein